MPSSPLISSQYLIVPYGNVNAKPMSPHTKSKVKYSRKVQLGLRVLALLGSLGLLFCVIAIKGTSGSLGWIIRVAPGVALLHTVYAVYHLCRSPTGRTPGSSASYMIFAAMIDAGLLPFLAFSAYMAHNEHATGMYGWDTLFGVPLTTWYIVYTTFLLCVIEGGLLLLSLLVGIYLGILFRKISKLPPDMNPLEPNLTSRPHKRNKSELTTSTKHMSQASLVSNKRVSSTADPLIAPGRRVPFMHTRTESADHVQPLASHSARSSRIDASRPDNLNRQSNNSFRGSYVPINKSLPSPPSRPQSAMAPSLNSRRAGTGPGYEPARSSRLAQDDTEWQGTHQNGRVSPLETYHQHVTSAPYSQAQPTNDENVRPVSPVSSGASTPDPDRSAEYIEIKNWYESPHTRNKSSQDYVAIPPQQYRPSTAQQATQDRRQSLYDFDRDLHSPSPEAVEERIDAELRNPLGMNPPTPALPEHQQEEQQEEQQQQQLNTGKRFYEEPIRYALHDAPVNLPPPSQRPKVTARPSSFVGSGSKGRYYGNLRSPVGSVNGSFDGEKHGGERGWGVGTLASAGSDTASNYSKETSERSSTMDSSSLGVGNLVVEKYRSHGGGSGLGVAASWTGNGRRFSFLHEEEEMMQGGGEDDDEVHDGVLHATGDGDGDGDGGGGGGGEYHDEGDRKGRVVSATGHDLSGAYAGLGAEFGRGMGRRREVSGKLAEEGRGHSFAGRTGFAAADPPARPGHAVTTRWHETGNGNGNVAGPGLAAAGWARFKGL